MHEGFQFPSIRLAQLRKYVVNRESELPKVLDSGQLNHSSTYEIGDSLNELFLLSKVESYNGFSKWFGFGGFGIIAHNDPIEQEKIIKYNDLIANAVIFHNVVDLTDILSDLKREGHLVTRDDVAVLSPYMTSHIKRFGDYLIDLNAIPQSLDEISNFNLI